MKHMLKTIAKTVKSVKGNSLAEFATTTALMATLAATAAPKLSEMSEGAKGEKSRNEIDKIVKQAGSFYQDIADLEGRGRFPNQTKFNVAVGGPNGNEDYSNQGSGGTYDLAADQTASDAHTAAIISDLRPDAETQAERTAGWDRFDETHSNVWRLVFAAGDNALPTSVSGVQDASTNNEWDSLFGDEVLESKFQDGRYVYTVVAGGGTGSDVYPPTIYVADIESAVDFHNLMMP
jgi:hypothetical protein